MKIRLTNIILILTDTSDYSTIQVLDWLDHYNVKYFVITDKDEITLTYIDKFSFEFIVNEKNIINSQEIENYWYRRGDLNLGKLIEFKIGSNVTLTNALKNYFSNEKQTIKEYLHYILHSNSNGISSFNYSSVNKLIVINEAIKCDLLVPEFLVANEKVRLKKFKKKYVKVITKPISNGILLNDKESTYAMYTKDLKNKDIEEYPTKFINSFFQKYIDKKFELRIFYLKPAFYSMAIFSQNNNKTKIDFRNYDSEVPNRVVPYNLPYSIENKLAKLMEKLNLESGSIDMILTNESEYYFLEVNPIGQFGMVSHPCNYFLEKLIAEYLINNSKNNYEREKN